jgi:hypothetical protein
MVPMLQIDNEWRCVILYAGCHNGAFNTCRTLPKSGACRRPRHHRG